VSDPRSSRRGQHLPPLLLRYGLAPLSVGFAVLLMLGVERLAGSYDARPALLLAVALSALFGGIGPAILALALATLAVRDPVLFAVGAILAVTCARFRRPVGTRVYPEGFSAEEPVERGSNPGATEVGPHKSPAAQRPNGSSPRLEVTSEATWRFHHEQPLDITLPEDEQVEHLYLYSVLAECNDAFARMYGFRSAADVVGTRLVVFLPPSNPANVAFLRSFIRSGYRLEDAESHEIDRYGHSKHFVNNLVGIFERGQLVGAWGTQRAIADDGKAQKPQEYSSRLHSTKSSSQ
jgi:hypothetical protein